MQDNWIVSDNDDEIINSIANGAGVSSLSAAIAYHRGIADADSARKFFDPERAQEFYDPFLMKGMDKAVERIIKALDNRERIVIYGDYDVDGMTASTVMMKCLQRLGAKVGSYIPSRHTEGYGFNVEALIKLTYDYDLLISVDCGISNNEEIAAVKNSLDVIVTDHHLPGGEVTNAIAVLDPHQSDCNYPDKNLCGAGVAFKLCQALNARLNGIDYKNYTADIELVALGTVADLVPLLGENRKIVRLGLKAMRDTSILGLRELIKVAGLEGKKITAGHCGFNLGPRLNAIGRLERASIGLELLTTNDQGRAQLLAQALDRENTLRKEIEAKMIAEADEEYQRQRQDAGGGFSSIVIAKEGWHKGVIGLAASRLVERYYLPTIIIALDGELAVGSCRSIPALHMKDALDHFGDRFLHYGGHAVAAGLTMKREDVEEFARDFDEYVRSKLNDADFIPKIKLDAEIHPSEITLDIAEELQCLSPFGLGNPHPQFGFRNVKGLNVRTMGGDSQHLSFSIEGVPVAPSDRYQQSSPSDQSQELNPLTIEENDSVEKRFIGVDECDEGIGFFGDHDNQIDFLSDEDDQPEDFDEAEIIPVSAVDAVEMKPMIRAVGWNMGEFAALVKEQPVDITFEPSINEFNDEKTVQCMISTLEPNGDNAKFPDRNALGRIYKYLRSQSKDETLKPFDICKLAAGFRRSTMAFDDPKFNSIYTLESAIKVFAEIGLIRFDADRKNFFMPVPKKTFDLNRSRLFKLNNEGGSDE